VTEKATAVIPARLQSARLPRKVLADIAGKPMIRHVYERTSTAVMISHVLVATDSEDVARVVREWGGQAIVTDAALPSGTARIASVIGDVDTDIIINVQGDQPLVEPELIDEVVRNLTTTRSDIVTPVFQITEFSDLSDPGIAKVVRTSDGRALYFSRSPIPYVRDIPMSEWPQRMTFWAHYGIYGFRRHVLEHFRALSKPGELEQAEKLEQLGFLEAGYHIHTIATAFRQVAVDTAEDLDRIRRMVQSVAQVESP
jgi:3-deoxy-manno-octulosonate cytidylyltransferase (CMP-KDO synthetase)